MPDKIAAVHHSIEDWDFQQDATYRSLANDYYISEPTSLKFSSSPGLLHNTFLCRIPATLNVAQGEVRTWLRRSHDIHGPSPAVFRNQAPLGTSDNSNCYHVWLVAGRVELVRIISGFPSTIATWNWAPPANTWAHVRTFWYNGKTPAEEDALCVDFYVEDADEWVKIEDTKYDPVNKWKDSEINRCGLYVLHRTGLESWFDDTEIWGPV